MFDDLTPEQVAQVEQTVLNDQARKGKPQGFTVDLFYTAPDPKSGRVTITAVADTAATEAPQAVMAMIAQLTEYLTSIKQ